MKKKQKKNTKSPLRSQNIDFFKKLSEPKWKLSDSYLYYNIAHFHLASTYKYAKPDLSQC